MHVAFVTTEFLRDGAVYPGGLANYLMVTARTLVAFGHRVTVFVSSNRNHEYLHEGIGVVEVATRAPFLLKPLSSLLSKWIPGSVNHVLGSLSLNRRLADRLGPDRIDIVQYSNWKSTGLFRTRHPSLMRISSYERLWDNDPNRKSLDKRMRAWLERIAFRRFDTIFGPGDHLADVIRRDLGLENAIPLLPTPVEFEPEATDRLFGVEGKRLVTFVGTVCRIKGSRLLFDFISEYLGRYDDTAFLVIGKMGTEDGRSCTYDVEVLSSRHPTLFKHIPHLGKKDLNAAYRQSDIVVIPSLIDNFPNTALEAAANGTLIVASDTASLGTLLSDGENSFILTSRSPSEWVEGVRRALCIDKSEREGMTAELRRRLGKHEAEKAVGALCELYRNKLSVTAA